MRVFSLAWGSSSWFIPYKSFLNLFQSKMPLYLADCLPYLSDLLAGIWSNFLAVNHVIYLWLSAQYFSLGKDAASCLFCSIFNMKEQFYKYIMSLNLIIWNSLEIEFAESWRFLKIIFFKALFSSIWSWFSLIFFDPKAYMNAANVNQRVSAVLFWRCLG